MRPVRILGVSLIVASMALLSIGMLALRSAWYVYVVFLLVVVGFILATGNLGRLSEPATAGHVPSIVVTKASKMSND
jgi:hypothetical protein